MTALAQIPAPPAGFAGTARYAIRARDKRDYNGVLDAKRILSGMTSHESVVTLREDSDAVVLETDHPMFTGRLREQIRYARTPSGLVADSLVREIIDDDGAVVRREAVPTYLHAKIGMPVEMYPEVTLPFILGWMPLDSRKSLYAWINDRFVAKLYVESAGKEMLAAPIGKRETVKVIMYPDLNDWISLGSVLTKLAKPFIPKYRMWFEAAAPHRLVRFEGPYGPPGAPEIVLELASLA
ncbi:MAG: hypothetical protein HOV81_28775 [Kofleriaceae bacterium]|nr:hypothetical protein [Kofleriaceae bacterium]